MLGTYGSQTLPWFVQFYFNVGGVSSKPNVVPTFFSFFEECWSNSRLCWAKPLRGFAKHCRCCWIVLFKEKVRRALKGPPHLFFSSSSVASLCCLILQKQSTSPKLVLILRTIFDSLNCFLSLIQQSEAGNRRFPNPFTLKAEADQLKLANRLS